MPGTTICFDCQISGGSTSGVFLTPSGTSSASTASASPTATETSTDDDTSHRGAHGPVHGSDLLSIQHPSRSMSTTSGASRTVSTPIISFPGGPIARITTSGTSSPWSVPPSSSASAASSASSNGLNGTKVAVIVLVAGVAGIVTSILLLLWLVSIRRRYRRSWMRIAEVTVETKSSGHSPEHPRARSADAGASSVRSEIRDARTRSERLEALVSQLPPPVPTREPAAPGSVFNATLPQAKARSREDLTPGDAPRASSMLDSEGAARAQDGNETGDHSTAREPRRLRGDTSSQNNPPRLDGPGPGTTPFTSPPPPYSQLSA